MEPELVIADADKIESMLYERFEDLLRKFLKKFSKSVKITKLHVTVDAHKASHKISEREKYSLRAELFTSKKLFNAHSFAWDLIDATHELVGKLEKQLIKYHDIKFKGTRPRLRLIGEGERIV